MVKIWMYNKTVGMITLLEEYPILISYRPRTKYDGKVIFSVPLSVQ